MTWIDDVLSPGAEPNGNAPARQAGAHTKQWGDVNDYIDSDRLSRYCELELELFRQCVALSAEAVMGLSFELVQHDFHSEHARVLWEHVQSVAGAQCAAGDGQAPLAGMAVLESLQSTGGWRIGSPIEQLWLDAQHANPTTVFAARRVAAALRAERARNGAEIVGRSLVDASQGTLQHIGVALEAIPHLQQLVRRATGGDSSAH